MEVNAAMSQSQFQNACITGIGAIAPFATGWNEIFTRIADGVPDYAPWGTDVEPPFENARLGIVRDFPRERYFNERQLRLMDKAMTMSSVAAAFAMEDAGILIDEEVIGRGSVATVLGTSRGETPSLYRYCTPLFRPQVGSVNPFHFSMSARNISCGQVAIRFGLRGWSSVIAAGDISGAHALARAVELIRFGRAQCVLVGAFELLSQISLHQLKGRWRKNELENAVARSTNNEYVPVEGACFFVVESEGHAAERGRAPYATISGANHGYQFADEGLELAGWEPVLKRHLASRSDFEKDEGVLHVCSSVTAPAGAAKRQLREASLNRAITEFGLAGRQILSRRNFGDAGSLNMLYGVATAATLLRNSRSVQSASAMPEYTPARSAVISTMTDRDAYSLVSLSA
ncbi:beta-ketoacyl synthase N-terminal-like domain-containing protein [Massilia sp. GER05]|uniref:beta-ketoacyl synthase N-terminal-like domain-containing protein n=1 Tax=Massilia sp. GER05 TaxID=3394605 RepID=UPI003F872780